MVARIIQALRPHQWAKNILLFLPIVLSHRLLDSSALVGSLLAFVAFSLAASAIYVLNDIVDIDVDRLHPIKSKRPFASGALSPFGGYVIFVALLVMALCISYTINTTYIFIMICYVVLSALYSFAFKKVLVLDVILLSLFYTIRIFAGSIAINAEITNWLIAFSIFIFLSLAFIKRHIELQATLRLNGAKLPGRGYEGTDLALISTLGPTSGMLSVLVLLLYLNDPQVTDKYNNPFWLWGVAIALLYWIIRVWFLTGREVLHSDPIVFALKDWPTYVLGLISLLFIYLAA